MIYPDIVYLFAWNHKEKFLIKKKILLKRWTMVLACQNIKIKLLSQVKQVG